MAKRSFFYGQVTGEFEEISTYSLSYETQKLANEIRKQTGLIDDQFIDGVAEAIVNTRSLEFDWHPDAPEAYKLFEKFWTIVQSGKPIGDAYMLLSKQVNGHIVNLWRTEMARAWQIWKPPEERMDANLDEAELADPKDE